MFQFCRLLDNHRVIVSIFALFRPPFDCWTGNCSAMTTTWLPSNFESQSVHDKEELLFVVRNASRQKNLSEKGSFSWANVYQHQNLSWAPREEANFFSRDRLMMKPRIQGKAMSEVNYLWREESEIVVCFLPLEMNEACDVHKDASFIAKNSCLRRKENDAKEDKCRVKMMSKMTSWVFSSSSVYIT